MVRSVRQMGPGEVAELREVSVGVSTKMPNSAPKQCWHHRTVQYLDTVLLLGPEDLSVRLSCSSESLIGVTGVLRC